MAVKSPRPYNSPQRDEQANATRRTILLAAEKLFAARGFNATTVPAIARQASLAPATVYLYFPGKAALVAALAEDLVTSADLSVEQVEVEPDPIAQVRLAARIISRLNQRSWVVADVLRSAQGTDPALSRIWRLWQKRHLAAIQRAVNSLASHSGLRDGLPVEAAVDTMYALAGVDVYRALTRDRGWSSEQYERWLFGLGCRELTGRPAP